MPWNRQNARAEEVRSKTYKIAWFDDAIQGLIFGVFRESNHGAILSLSR